MNPQDDKMASSEEKSFSVGQFNPDDAMGIVQLFQAVYGNDYPIRVYYDPAALIVANAEGRIHSIVARNPSGKVIGMTNLFLSKNNKSLYEWGAGLVHMEYRNAGVNAHLADFLHNTFVPQYPAIEGLYGEAVCNHVHLQKMVTIHGYVEVAIELALMPKDAFSREHSADGRVATLTGFRCYRPKLHRIFPPPAYETMLRRIYGRLDDKRDMAVAKGTFPAGQSTIAELSIFDSAQVARITVSASGDDFTERLSDLEDKARVQKAVVFQVFLNLMEPWIGEAVDILRSRGYFFGGAMPRWFDGDGLLMQKLDCSPDFEGIALLQEFSKELLTFIRKDWERATGLP